MSMMIDKDTNFSTMKMTGHKERIFARICLSRPINENVVTCRETRDLRTQIYENSHQIIDLRSHVFKSERADLQY